MLKHFSHDGLSLAYLDTRQEGGHGTPVLLIHGFASLIRINWVGPGWVKTLTEAGYRVIAIENRGHGASEKPHDPAAYATPLMAEDARALLDHLGIQRAFVQGYSMGARISAFLAMRHPERVAALALGGLGIHLVDGVGLPLGIAEAMETADASGLTDPTQIMFRSFAEKNGQDLLALAACIRGSRQVLDRSEVARLAAPTLIAVGTRDDIAGAPEPLAAMMPDARAFAIEGRDHNLAVGDRTHRAEVLAFFDQIRQSGGMG
ncbi:MAG: alpha/beta hydrolase [Proteobacteria bacterium]|nr:alpha/beta hydrolase [Pseudomonadota bacterium]